MLFLRIDVLYMNAACFLLVSHRATGQTDCRYEAVKPANIDLYFLLIELWCHMMLSERLVQMMWWMCNGRPSSLQDAPFIKFWSWRVFLITSDLINVFNVVNICFVLMDLWQIVRLFCTIHEACFSISYTVVTADTSSQTECTDTVLLVQADFCSFRFI